MVDGDTMYLLCLARAQRILAGIDADTSAAIPRRHVGVVSAYKTTGFVSVRTAASDPPREEQSTW